MGEDANKSTENDSKTGEKIEFNVTEDVQIQADFQEDAFKSITKSSDLNFIPGDVDSNNQSVQFRDTTRSRHQGDRLTTRETLFGDHFSASQRKFT